MSKLTRRRFLKIAGTSAGCIAVAGALGSTEVLASGEVFSGHPDRRGMLIDTTSCVGCRTCEAACNKVNNLPTPEVPFTDRSVLKVRRRPNAQAVTVVNQYANPKEGGPPLFRKQQCMHCEEPACASACLVGAMKKTPEGPVIYNKDVCMGCRYCMLSCPFYSLSYEYNSALSPRVMKCTMCYQRLKDGDVPACAAACPTKSIIFGKRSDLLQVARQRIGNNPEKYVNHIYGEWEAGGTGVLYLASVPFDKLGLPTNLPTTPYPELTRDFLTAVPLVLMGWPALFLGLNAFAKRREKNGQSDDEQSTDNRRDEE